MMKKKNPEPPKGTTLKASQARYNTSQDDFYKKENQKAIEGKRKDPDYIHDWGSAVQADIRARKSGLKKPSTYEKDVARKFAAENMDRNIKTKNVSSKRDGDRSSFSGQTLEKAQMRKNIESKKAQMNKPKPVVKATAKPMPKKKGK